MRASQPVHVQVAQRVSDDSSHRAPSPVTDNPDIIERVEIDGVMLEEIDLDAAPQETAAIPAGVSKVVPHVLQDAMSVDENARGATAAATHPSCLLL